MTMTRLRRAIRPLTYISGVTHKVRERRDKRSIRPHFDAADYLRRYSDVALSGMDPLEHYVRWGQAEGRSPHAQFHADKYRLAHPDCGEKPFEHAIRTGAFPAPAPEPLKAPREAGTAFAAAVEEMLEQQSEQIPIALPTPAEMLVISDHMDCAWYFDRYPDASRFGLSAPAHYCALGWRAGYDPSPEFSTLFYLKNNQDVAVAGVNPFAHHLLPQQGNKTRRYASVAHAEILARFEEGPLAKDLARAIELDPMVALPVTPRRVTSPYDIPRGVANAAESLRRELEGRAFHHVILLPQVRMSGAARVAGLYAKELCARVGADQVLLVLTDADTFERPDWFPPDLRVTSLARHIAEVAHQGSRQQLLIDLLRGVGCHSLHVFNSRLGWDCLMENGSQMCQEYGILTYLFTWEETEDGRKVGLPIQSLARCIPHIDCILCDSKMLADHIVDRFALPKQGPGSPIVARTPTELPCPANFEKAVSRQDYRIPERRVLWAGRLDRQKRPDLLVEIARQMPDHVFEVYGRTVLSKALPDGIKEQPNIHMMGEFRDLSEIMERQYGAYLYTSQWDGIPTILLDVIAQALPVVASCVGGVSELIEDKTGWPVKNIEAIEDYVSALHEAIEPGPHRADRSRSAYARASVNHAGEAYTRAVSSALDRTRWIREAW